jgi:hypothetical protein
MTSRLGTLLRVVTAAIALAGCDTYEDPVSVGPSGPTGRIRAVHVAPDTQRARTIDVRVDNQPLNLSTTAQSLGYGVASPYTPVYAGTRTITVRKGGDSTTTLFSQSITIDEGGNYTVLATGSGASIAAIVLTDETSPPPADSVRVRVVNAAPSAPSVDVYITSPATDITTVAPTIPALTYPAPSGYVTLAAASYRIRFTTAGTKTVVRDINPLALTAGQIRTIVLADRAAGGTPLTSVVLVDR